METATRKHARPETVLLIAALFCATLLIVMVVLCLPYFGREDASPAETTEQTQPQTTEETEPETTEEETEPQLPPPEENPYGRNDFQYDSHNYLKCIAGESVSGIDVSSHQGLIDWGQVKASGIEFAMIRVGYRGYGTGMLTEDAYARFNLEGAIAAGLDVGVYIFSQALNVEEAAEEARFLLDIIRDYEITMPVVFDWEKPSAETARTADFDDAQLLTESTLEFCRIIEEAGYTPMVYFNRYQAKYLMDLAQLKAYDFWLAAYTDRMEYPYKVKMWQYTDSGKVPGIEGYVDIDILFIYE